MFQMIEAAMWKLLRLPSSTAVISKTKATHSVQCRLVWSVTLELGWVYKTKPLETIGFFQTGGPFCCPTNRVKTVKIMQ